MSGASVLHQKTNTYEAYSPRHAHIRRWCETTYVRRVEVTITATYAQEK